MRRRHRSRHKNHRSHRRTMFAREPPALPHGRTRSAASRTDARRLCEPMGLPAATTPRGFFMSPCYIDKMLEKTLRDKKAVTAAKRRREAIERRSEHITMPPTMAISLRSISSVRSTSRVATLRRQIRKLLYRGLRKNTPHLGTIHSG